MKLPFEFGPKLFFRLGLPGLVLALTTAPLVFAFANAIKMDIDRWEVIAVSTVIWGWAFVLADMPIYMLYEGRRFWPRAALDWGMNREKRRLAGLYPQVAEDTGKRDPRATENDIELLNFPINIHTGEAEVRFPTRLGNLITAYEEHTYVAYKIDAIFYWPRLWVVLDKDLREEIDNQQAIADSSVYTSFALWLSAIFLTCYALANEFFHARLGGVPSPRGLIALAAGSCGAAYLIYRVSLFAHAQFGEIFKAVFDQHLKKLRFTNVIQKIGDLTGDTDALKRPEVERYMMVSRYLRWHRIRPPGEEKNVRPETWRKVDTPDTAIGGRQGSMPDDG